MKGDFEKRLLKGTYQHDSKEPKEKHAVYLANCLSGHDPENDAELALEKVLTNLSRNKTNWSVVGKTYIIMHRVLKDKNSCVGFANLLMSQKDKLVEFWLSLNNNKFQSSQISKRLLDPYVHYIRLLAQSIMECDDTMGVPVNDVIAAHSKTKL